MTATMAEVKNRNGDQHLALLDDFPNPDDFVKHVSARIFKFLAETAGPIMEHFQGDLYYDALMITEKIKNWDAESDIQWVWSVNETGTDWREVNTTLSQVRKYCFLCTVSTIKKNYGTMITFNMERINND
jgi:hypothetical protein